MEKITEQGFKGQIVTQQLDKMMEDHFPGSGNSIYKDWELWNKMGHSRSPSTPSSDYEILVKQILSLTPG